MYNVALALVTNSNLEKINNYIKNLKNELKTPMENISVKIYICINGINNIKTFEKIKDMFGMQYNIIFKYDEGKNDSINYLMQFIRNDNMDIVHFFDDDIEFKKGSIYENIEELIFLKNLGKEKVIVGSNFYAKIDKKLKGFNYLKQYIFSTPYDLDSDLNYFIAGCSNCTWVEYYPQLPDSSTDIAEDSFLAIYFAKIGGGLKAIVKPKNSVVYFELPTTYKEWFNQQVRTYIGVEKSFRLFKERYEYFQYMFAWRYAEDPKFRKKYIKLNIKNKIRLWIFRILQKRVYIQGNKMLREKIKVCWK